MNFCTTCQYEFGAEEEQERIETPEQLTECPNCQTDVDAGDSFCSNCGTDLEAHRDDSDSPAVEPPQEHVQRSQERVDQQQDSPSVKPDSDAGSAESEQIPDYLTFEVDGVTVTDQDDTVVQYRDGDTLGKRIRTTAVDAGVSRQDVQYIHRSHVKLVREPDGFYVLNHENKDRKNRVRVNDEEIAIGERTKLSNGDTIELSDVATAAVTYPES